MKVSAILVYGAALAAGAIAALASASAPVLAQSGQTPGSVCLEPSQIRFTQIKDNRTIVFQMRNGDIWENTLVANCPNLKTFNQGFSQNVVTNRICAFQQTITLIQTGNVCRLGAFTRVK